MGGDVPPTLGGAPQTYSVPVVYQELPPTEGLGQIFDSLKHLQKLCDQVFQSVQDRVTEERNKLQAINTRIESCKSRIRQVEANPNKATTVYSTTKYPAPDQLVDFSRMNYAEGAHPLSQPPSQRRPVSDVERMSGSRPVNTQTLFNNLTGALEKPEVQIREGLGRLPSYLPSISSILLFNSAENPYKTYVSLDNLEGIGGIDREKEVEELAAAPTTLIEGTMLPTFAAPQLAYQPDLGDVPTFDLPANLPLAQLADIRFDTEQQASIAPSMAQLPALPSVEDFQVSKAKQPKTAASVPAPPASTPAPPTNTTNTGAVTRMGGDSVPAPPPVAAGVPAPPPVAAPAAPAAPTPAAAPKKAAAPPAEGRMGLLESIRNPGLKLRKVTDNADGASPRQKRKKESAPEAGGGDMMSALKNILAMRRKATSGKTDKEESKGGGRVAVPTISDDENDEGFDDDDWA